MDGDDVDKVRIEAKTKDIIPIYIRGWDTYKWAWLEYNRKEKSWTYGGMQKRKDKMDEDEEGQRRINSPEKILIKMRAKTPGNGIAGRRGGF